MSNVGSQGSPPVINIFGIVHQHGGCGTEALGAIELIRSKGVAVLCIVPPDDEIITGSAADFLRSTGVAIVNYAPGIFKKCDILISFAEGQSLFPLIEKYDDRPRFILYSDCMHYATDDEAGWHKRNLIDAFFFQTRALADRLGPEIVRKAKKSMTVRHGYRAFINTHSDYFPLRFRIERDDKLFTAIKVTRDDAEKWHLDTWRMFCGISAPANRKVQIEVVGWGDNAQEKIGALDGGPWDKQINAQINSHVHDPKEMAALYGRAHVLIHVCDYEWEDALGRVMLEAMVAGTVVIADNRGGAKELIRHGETGFLVDSPDEASFYASKLAFDDGLRRSIAAQAYVELTTLGHGNADVCWKWWQDLLNSKHGVQTASAAASAPRE